MDRTTKLLMLNQDAIVYPLLSIGDRGNKHWDTTGDTVKCYPTGETVVFKGTDTEDEILSTMQLIIDAPDISKFHANDMVLAPGMSKQLPVLKVRPCYGEGAKLDYGIIYLV